MSKLYTIKYATDRIYFLKIYNRLISMIIAIDSFLGYKNTMKIIIKCILLQKSLKKWNKENI